MTRNKFIEKIEGNLKCRVLDCYERFDKDAGMADYFAVVLDYTVDEDIYGEENYCRVAYRYSTMTEDFGMTSPKSRDEAYEEVARDMFYAVFRKMKAA